MTQLTLEYIFFVSVATCGVLQITASYSNLRRLLFFQNRGLTYILAILAIGGDFGWFFGWDDRLAVEIMHTGLEGSQQFSYFLLGAIVGIVVTLLISSLVHLKSSGDLGEDTMDGLDCLKDSNYLSALRSSFRKGKPK